jgi:sugar diacid utilization regulator
MDDYDTTFAGRAIAEFVARLVDGTWNEERELHRTSRTLGIDLGQWWTFLLLTPVAAHQDVDLERQAAFLRDALPEALTGSTRTVPSRHLPVLVPAPDPVVREVAAGLAAEHELLIVIPETSWRWTALAHVYRQQADGIVCARAAACRPGVVGDTDCRMYSLLRALPMPQRVDYVHSVLGPVFGLPAGKSAEALSTLDAYFRGRGRLDETAADLQIHRNSFRYRLERAQAILGVNFRNGRDRLRVELALALRRLDREEAMLLEDSAVAAPPLPVASARRRPLG